MFPRLTAFDILKLFFRALFTLLVVAVFVVLFWRMGSSRVPAELVTLTPNDTLVAAYAEEGDGLYKLTQEQNTITRNEENYGYFTASSAIFVPGAEQLQLLVRYNDSTLKALQKDYGLDFLPQADKDWYDVTLVLAIDKTPDNAEDNLANDPASVELVRVRPSELAARAHHGRHSYRKFVFDGVDFDGGLLAVYVDFYYIGDLAYEEEGFDAYTDKAYGTLCLYAFTEDAINKQAPLSDADKAALAAVK